ncbi:MAG TPA: protein kinase [Caulifigura sp.]|nr:protein kinase [Caulifigura sp.]
MVRIGSFQNVDSSAHRVVLSQDGKTAQSSKFGSRVVSTLARRSSDENVAVKKAFVKSIQDAYGSGAAEQVRLKLDMSGKKPLTGRQVQQLLSEQVTVHRRSDLLQSGDIKMLLGRAGALDQAGAPTHGAPLFEHLEFLKDAVRDSKPELNDKLAFASDDDLKSFVAKSLNLDVGSDGVARTVAAIREGAPNQISDDRETLTLNGKTFTKGKFLGEGGFGAAHVYNSDDGDSVVLKSLSEPDRNWFDSPTAFQAEKDNKKAQARDECQAHRYATSSDGEPDSTGADYVAGFGGPIRSSDGTIHLVIQHCSVGDVTSLWGSRHGESSGIDRLVAEESLTPRAANTLKASMAHDLIKGMQHLQLKRNMMHLDLKPHNLFMDSSGRCKIGDFGLAEATMAKPLPEAFQTTRQYQSPELHKASLSDEAEDRVAFTTSDSYSVGYMLHELATGGRAFDGERAMSFATNRDQWFAEHDSLAVGELSTGHPDWDALINGLTHKDPDKRMNLEDALKSPLFAGILKPDGSDVKPEIRSLLPKVANFARTSHRASTEQNDAIREGHILELVAIRYEIMADAMDLEPTT